MDYNQLLLEMIVSIVTSPTVRVVTITAIVSGLLYKLVRTLTSDELPPPGPWGLPFFGHLPLLGKEPNVTFMKMREKFGDVFQIKLGNWSAVVVNGRRAIVEALQNSEDDFSGRPRFLSSKMLSDGESLSLGQFNDTWMIQYKVASRVLSQFSSGRTTLEDIVHGEVDNLINSFKTQRGQSFDPHDLIFLSCTSVIYQICYGQELTRESENFKTFLLNSREFPNFLKPGNPIDIFPCLQYVMPWKLRKFSSLILTLRNFRQKRVEEHKETFSPDHLRDLTDGVLAVCRENTALSEDRFCETIDAFFGAGSDTVTSTLRWTVMLMAAHPDVQKRVQAEIDDIVGPGRWPRIQDRDQLVFTEAVLHEINRYVALEPLALPHSTTRDTMLDGFCIKKDTLVFINLYSMSHDKSVWGDPGVFRPERFLDESGQIKKSLLREFLPFSTGRRQCIGQSMVKRELFLFFTGLLQKCSIIKPPEVAEYSMNADVGLHRECRAYKVHVRLRN